MASRFNGASGAQPLSEATLDLHRTRMRVPTYARESLTPSVVHIGVGGFHRSHQAVFFDDLAEEGVSSEWGVVGVGLRRRAMKDALEPQDCLFTVVERSARGDSARVVGAMRRYLWGPEDPEAVLSALTDSRTRLVTLTATGDGYNVDRETGEFQAGAPDVQADLRDPARPTTAIGYLVEALARRRAAGLPPFTVLSCDNIPRNGDVTRTAVVSLARMRDELLARWIDRHGAFPSSMVDRITPATTDADRDRVLRTFGVDDRWPVVTEPFTQWVVEDRFCNGRPPLDAVGVQFVDDVGAYQLMKNRLLNAGHSAIGYLGTLAGYSRTDEAMRDPALEDYLVDLMGREVAPLLAPAPGVDVADYQRTLVERFSNPKIGDPLARLCGRGSTKMPAYLLPSIKESAKRGRRHPMLTLAVAAWFFYLRGHDCYGSPIEVRDALSDELQPCVVAAGYDPRPLLARRDIFGSLGADEAFASDLERMIVALDRGGVAGALESSVPAALAGVA